MNLEARIKKIKDTNNNAIIERAKAEERLKHLEEQKKLLEKQAKDLNVDPIKLDQAIAKDIEEIEKLTKQAEKLLGLDSSDDEDSPF